MSTGRSTSRADERGRDKRPACWRAVRGSLIGRWLLLRRGSALTRGRPMAAGGDESVVAAQRQEMAGAAAAVAPAQYGHDAGEEEDARGSCEGRHGISGVAVIADRAVVVVARLLPAGCRSGTVRRFDREDGRQRLARPTTEREHDRSGPQRRDGWWCGAIPPSVSAAGFEPKRPVPFQPALHRSTYGEAGARSRACEDGTLDRAIGRPYRERGTGLEPATYSLEGYRSTN